VEAYYQKQGGRKDHYIFDNVTYSEEAFEEVVDSYALLLTEK
jgi:hypothetical protein